ncbi:MAG: APC family permease [Hyphomonadaceae bacterium]|nr:APC family permease [Clostridia bacterium]
MFKRLKKFLVGKPLTNEQIEGEKFGILWGLPILSSDAISSVAYAGQEMLIVLIPAIGMLAFSNMAILSSAIIILLIVLVISYRQTIECYPNGGGAYIVAKDNMGVLAGVTAGSALSVDYVLTVAVSISSGVEQIVSAFAPLHAFKVEICVVLIILLMIGNLRGISESSKMFGIPAYAFIFAILAMIVTGVFRIMNGQVPSPPSIAEGTPYAGMALFVLMLRAFSNGCTALTGIEAVSNAVPNFKEPSAKHAKSVLVILALIILVLFGGTSFLAQYFKVNPLTQGAVLVVMAKEIFNGGFMFYFVVATTFTILILAANTAFSGFPMLISVMAKEGYAPRQLSMRGDRLSYDNGIVLLSVSAIILVIMFNATVSSLIGLYAIGVFISFTLSQSGMFLKWMRHKGDHWQLKAFINGFGAVLTTFAMFVIAFTKFHEGAWIVVILIPTMIFGMLKVKKHYAAVVKQLRIKHEDYDTAVEKKVYRNRVIIPIESINKSSVRALRYAKTISDNVVAFSVAIDTEAAKELQQRYDHLNVEDIPLFIKYSPFRQVVEPLLEFIESAEYDYQKGDMITVIVPQFVVKKWWHRFLHNNTREFLERELLKHKHIVVSVMPLQLKDDDEVLKQV